MKTMFQGFCSALAGFCMLIEAWALYASFGPYHQAAGEGRAYGDILMGGGLFLSFLVLIAILAVAVFAQRRQGEQAAGWAVTEKLALGGLGLAILVVFRVFG